MPETVTSPRIEGTMVTGFFYSVKHIVEFDDMPAPSSFADVDAGTRSIIDAIVADCDVSAHG